MQSICSDIVHHAGKTYIVLVDRFSNWPSVHKTGGGGGVEDLVKVL